MFGHFELHKGCKYYKWIKRSHEDVEGFLEVEFFERCRIIHLRLRKLIFIITLKLHYLFLFQYNSFFLLVMYNLFVDILQFLFVGN